MYSPTRKNILIDWWFRLGILFILFCLKCLTVILRCIDHKTSSPNNKSHSFVHSTDISEKNEPIMFSISALKIYVPPEWHHFNVEKLFNQRVQDHFSSRQKEKDKKRWKVLPRKAIKISVLKGKCVGTLPNSRKCRRVRVKKRFADSDGDLLLYLNHLSCSSFFHLHISQDKTP